jgi:hypothetical protein
MLAWSELLAVTQLNTALPCLIDIRCRLVYRGVVMHYLGAINPLQRCVHKTWMDYLIGRGYRWGGVLQRESSKGFQVLADCEPL